jgi:hypothetical protein
MPTATRTFRVFVSSTFEDLKAERDALAAPLLPGARGPLEQKAIFAAHHGLHGSSQGDDTANVLYSQRKKCLHNEGGENSDLDRLTRKARTHENESGFCQSKNRRRQ